MRLCRHSVRHRYLHHERRKDRSPNLRREGRAQVSVMSRVRQATPEVEQQDIDEARAFNSQLEALIATQAPIFTLAPEVARRLRREGKGIFPAPVLLEDARDVEIAGRGGPIKLRLIRPDHKPTGIYLHIHGGGWTLGAHDMQDVGLKLLANETGLCAASIDYRLAP